jgi:hypothetical protein
MAAGVTTSSHTVAPSCLSGPWRSPGRAWAGSAGAATVVERPSGRFCNGWRGGSAEPSRHPCRTFLHRCSFHRQSVDPNCGLCGPDYAPDPRLGQTLRAWLALQPVGCHRPRGCDPPGEPADLGHLARLSALNCPAFPAACTLICIKAVLRRSSRSVRPAIHFQFPPKGKDFTR